MLLDLIDLQITYRSRTLIGVALAPVRDMALLDPFNPRSVAFQVNLIDEHLAALPALKQDGVPEEPRRMRLCCAPNSPPNTPSASTIRAFSGSNSA